MIKNPKSGDKLSLQKRLTTTQATALAKVIQLLSPEKTPCFESRGMHGKYGKDWVPTRYEDLAKTLASRARHLGKNIQILRSTTLLREKIFDVQTWAKGAIKGFAKLEEVALAFIVRTESPGGSCTQDEVEYLNQMGFLLRRLAVKAEYSAKVIPIAKRRTSAMALPLIEGGLDRTAYANAIDDLWLLWNWWVGTPEMYDPTLRATTEEDPKPTGFEQFLFQFFGFAQSVNSRLKVSLKVDAVRDHAWPVHQKLLGHFQERETNLDLLPGSLP